MFGQDRRLIGESGSRTSFLEALLDRGIPEPAPNIGKGFVVVVLKSSADEWWIEPFEAEHARTILELGSLEGGHTWGLATRPGVRKIFALEGRAANVRRQDEAPSSPVSSGAARSLPGCKIPSERCPGGADAAERRLARRRPINDAALCSAFANVEVV